MSNAPPKLKLNSKLNSNSKPKSITIVGAGLVGSLLSVMLGQRGYTVDVYEQRDDMRDREVESGRSINLALSQRGIYALQQAGLMDQVQELLIPMRGRVLHAVNGQTTFSPYGQRPEEVIYSVSRGELNALMMTAADVHPDVTLHFNKKTEKVDFENNELTTTDRKDGASSVVQFEIVVGADGAGSKVRQSLMARASGRSSSEFLDHDYKELEIPACPAGDHQMEREALHIWPRGGYMLIALPNLDGSFTVTLFMPKTGDPSFELIDQQVELEKFFQEQFPDAMRLMPDLINDYLKNPQGRLGTVRCQPWCFEDDSLILGDASHAIVPFHGQGMNSGLEDCSELIRLLGVYDDDWTRALPEFDRLRRPNAEAIADMALENYITMRDSVNDSQYPLKKEIGFQLERDFPNRYMPRYSMVMFHRIPYAQAFQRGKIQADILNQLCLNKTAIEEIDFGLAGKLVLERLSEVDFD